MASVFALVPEALALRCRTRRQPLAAYNLVMTVPG
jgi:hypothetical protein